METLREAYGMAKQNDGAPGVDGVTFETIEAQGVEALLEQLRDELTERTYQPLPARRQEIPKDGGKVRVLSIPTVTSNCTSAPSDFGFDGDNPSLSSASWPTIYRPEGQEGFWR
jgi:hypothetical protein